MADPYFSDSGIDFLKEAEGVVKEGDLHVTYIDSVGVKTIGYGHTGPDVSMGQKISEAEAERLLREDVAEAEAAVRNSVKVDLLPNQFDALVEFTFNVGVGKFTDSTLLELLNAGLYEEIPAQLGRWVKGKVNGEKVVLPGLVNRRNAEIEVWNDDEAGRIEAMNRAVESYDYAEAARQALKIDQTPGVLGLTDVYQDAIIRKVASASPWEIASWAISQMEADGVYVDPIVRSAAVDPYEDGGTGVTSSGSQLGGGEGAANNGHGPSGSTSGTAGSGGSTVTGRTTSQTTYSSGGTTHTATSVTGGGGGGADSGQAANPEDDPTASEGRRPILLDLDGDGVKITEFGKSSQFVAGKDGLQHRTSWVGAGDGVLFFDPDGRNAITEARQYVFTEWDPTASGDLEAIRSTFDSNGDGKLTAADAEFAKFAKFKVMVTNADGSTTVKTLAELGITEINLTANAVNIGMPDGSMITGQTTFTCANGTTGTVANTTLVAEATGQGVPWRLAA